MSSWARSPSIRMSRSGRTRIRCRARCCAPATGRSSRPGPGTRSSTARAMQMHSRSPPNNQSKGEGKMVAELGPVSILTDNLAFPEDPRWHQGRFYFADMLDRRVARIGDDGSVTTLATFEDSPSGIGFLPDGDMLVVSMYHEQLIRVDAQGNKSLYADLGAAAGTGVNDMVVDKEGRAYIVQFGGDHYAPTARPLIVVQPNGSVGNDGEPLMVGNGIRITQDGQTLGVGGKAGNT